MLPPAVSRFVQRYPGVQGFYFINRNADLGFLRPTDAKPVKETFPQLHDRKFTRKHPSFVLELENFLRDVQEISNIYLNSADTDIELGYILPAGDNDHEWQSATLMVHDDVVDTIQFEQQQKQQYDIVDSSPLNLTAEELQGACSAHRGLNYLAKYVDASGSHIYFPALFLQPTPAATNTQAAGAGDRGDNNSLRVINLLWHRPVHGHRSASHHDSIFSLLRRNLEVRGALARDQHRLVEAEALDPLVTARNPAGTDLRNPQ